MTPKKIRDTIRRLLEESPAPESPTYREQIARKAVEATLSALERGEKGAVKDAVSLIQMLEGQMPVQVEVAQARPIIFDPAVGDID